MEYVNGVLLSDILTGVRRDRTACVAELRQRGCDPDRVAANIVCNFLNQVYAIGLFHADLHPANLLVLPGNRIAYDARQMNPGSPSPPATRSRYQLRFFSAVTLDEVHDSLRPAELVNTVMEFRYRIDRALDFLDRVITEERAVADILGTARTWIERLALAAVLGVLVAWLVERFTGYTRGIFSTNAGFVLIIFAGVFVGALLRQTRKLPDTRSRGRRRRRLKRRQAANVRNGRLAQRAVLAQPHGSRRRGSDEADRRRPDDTSPSDSTVDF